MFAIITDKILTHYISCNIPKEIPNLTPPLAASAINQVSSQIFYHKLLMILPVAIEVILLGRIKLKSQQKMTQRNKNQIEMLYALAAFVLVSGTLLGGAIWYREKNFHQILLPQLQEIAKRSSE